MTLDPPTCLDACRGDDHDPHCPALAERTSRDLTLYGNVYLQTLDNGLTRRLDPLTIAVMSNGPLDAHHPGAPEALGYAALALARLAWTWLRTKLHRRPDSATLHQPWCPALRDDTPADADCECWRFLLETDPTAETLIDPHDHYRTDG